MKKRDIDHIDILTKMAEANEPVFRTRFAASIVIRNKTIAFGINQTKTHPMQHRFCKHHDAIWLHAEIAAIKNSLRYINIDELKRSTLYISRVKYSDDKKTRDIWGTAKPCCGCMGAIKSFEIPRVVYTTNKQELEEIYIF